MANGWRWCRKHTCCCDRFVPLATGHHLRCRRPSVRLAAVYTHWIDFNPSATYIHRHEGDHQRMVRWRRYHACSNTYFWMFLSECLGDCYRYRRTDYRLYPRGMMSFTWRSGTPHLLRRTFFSSCNCPLMSNDSYERCTLRVMTLQHETF